MATTFTPGFLSGSPNGLGVLVAATGSPGTLIHTPTTASGSFEQISLYASNIHTTNVLVTVEWGETATKGRIQQTVNSKEGLYLLIPQLRISGNNPINVYASVANVITIFGGKELYTPPA